MSATTGTTVLLPIDDNQGYSPDQVETGFTLADLLAVVQEAIAQHGDDAVVVLDNGQRYGAQYGRIDRYRDMLAPVEGDEEDLECGYCGYQASSEEDYQQHHEAKGH